MTTIPIDHRDDPAAAHEHDPHLAHHFDTPAQQFEAAKLGMWLFLATEVLLFGGLFCLYAVLRANKPEVFAYGSQFLDTRWGLVNTAVLITSSLTMAAAVTAAQRNQYRWLIGLLLLTLLGAATFMAIKYVEYNHKFHDRLVWGTSFYDAPAWAIAAAHDEESDAGPGTVAATAAPYTPDIDNGRALWQATCRSCHGAAGEGVAGQGKDLRGAAFISERDDDALLAFLEAGRVATDPLNTTGVTMPPKGGNPLLTDHDLLDVIALIRTFEGGPMPTPAGDESEPGPVAAPEPFWTPMSSIPNAPTGPGGLSASAWPSRAASPHHEDLPHHAVDPARPANAHLFFGLYFCLTGLHGLHVLLGMVVIAWLTVRAIKRDFGPDYFTPVDLGALYWHIVDLIWIFLFPLLYLIS